MRATPGKRLYQIAEKQQGLFTAKQAVCAGYLAKNHTYHIKHHHWIREHRGIYRLANFPYTPEGEMVLWSLWSRNRKESPQGVYSHETALSLYDVSDAMPAKLQMTVPTTFRRSTETPPILILRRAKLFTEEIAEKTGYRLTTPFRTIKDLITEKSTDENILDQAIHEFRLRGLLTEKQLLRLVEEYPSLARHLLQSRVSERKS